MEESRKKAERLVDVNTIQHTVCLDAGIAIDEPADYQAKDIRAAGKGIQFDVYHGEEKLGHVTLNIPGRHNVLDAMACIVTGLSIGVPFEKMAEGLAAFHGAKRRFQTKGHEQGIWVVDDYAHHPTEIAATLKAAKETNPKRLICAFQPHRYSRTQLLHEEFGKAFVSADILVLTDVYAAGEAPIPGISGETICITTLVSLVIISSTVGLP